MNRSGLGQRLVGLFLLGLVLLGYPLLSAFSKPLLVLGIPLLFLYLFTVWLAIIVAVGWLIERAGPAADDGPSSGDSG